MAEGDQLLEAAKGQGDVAQRAQQNTEIKNSQNNLGSEEAEKQGLSTIQDRLSVLNNEITITPQIALGLVKSTGNKEWMKASGTKMRGDVVMAFLKDGINQKLMGKVFKVQNGDKEVSLTWTQDEQGELKPSIIGEGDKFSPTQKGDVTPEKAITNSIAQQNADANTKRANTSASKSSDSSDKDLDKWFKNANTARKEIQDTFTKKGGMPKTGKVHDIVSMFSGGDPANDARIASLKQNYSDYQTAVQNYNQLAEKNGKSPMNIDPSVSAAMDKVMALPGAKGAPDDQAVSDYLKKSNARDTPANRKWAEEQLSAK